MGKIVNKKFIFSLLVTVLGFIVLVSGTSYAILRGETESVNEQLIKAGSVELVLTENFEGLNKGISVMEDPDGLLQETVYEFNIRNIGSVAAKYDLKLEDSGTNTISDSYIKVGLEVNGKEMGPMKLSSVSNVIDSNNISKNEVVRYKLRLWIDHVETNNFTGESTANLVLKVEAKQAEYKSPYVYRFGGDDFQYNVTKAGTYTGYCLYHQWEEQGESTWSNSCSGLHYGYLTQEQCQKVANRLGGNRQNNSFTCISGTWTTSSNTTYTSEAATLSKTVYLKYELGNNSEIKSESICYILNSEEYCLKGLDGVWDSTKNVSVSPSYTDNKKTMEESFGKSNCNETTTNNISEYSCTLSGISVNTYSSGMVEAGSSTGTCEMLDAGEPRGYGVSSCSNN